MLTRTFLTTPQGQFPMLLLGPVAVILEQWNQGIGTALIETVCQRARASGSQAVILVDNPDFYRRFDFRPAVDFGIRNTDQIPAPFDSVRELIPKERHTIFGVIGLQV
jgi:predicted N-acetyltransferase YhbS